MSPIASARSRVLVLCLGLLALDTGVAAAAPRLDDDPSVEDPRLYLGMWTAHVRSMFGAVDSNQLVGVGFRGFYGGTFINSYGSRSVAAGIQRTLLSTPSRTTTPSLGYRLGLVTGYDERFMGIAGRLPALPMAQIVGRLDRGKIGAELAYSGLAVSLALSGRF